SISNRIVCTLSPLGTGVPLKRRSKSPYKSHKQLLALYPLSYPRVQVRGVGFEPTTSTFHRFVCFCRWVRACSHFPPRPSGETVSGRSFSPEDGLGPDGQVAGRMPVDHVIAQARFRHIQVAGEGLLECGVAGERPGVEVGQRDVPAVAFETNVDHGLAIE